MSSFAAILNLKSVLPSEETASISWFKIIPTYLDEKNSFERMKNSHFLLVERCDNLGDTSFLTTRRVIIEAKLAQVLYFFNFYVRTR